MIHYYVYYDSSGIQRQAFSGLLQVEYPELFLPDHRVAKIRASGHYANYRFFRVETASVLED